LSAKSKRVTKKNNAQKKGIMGGGRKKKGWTFSKRRNAKIKDQKYMLKFNTPSRKKKKDGPEEALWAWGGGAVKFVR